MKRTLSLLIVMGIAMLFQCTIGRMSIEVLDNYSVIAVRHFRYKDFGRTIKNEEIVLHGKKYKIPAGTLINNSDFAGLTFPVMTYLPVGKNLVPFAANEWVSILYDDSVYVMSGVLAHNIVLEVGNRQIPFWAARNSPESKKYRGEFQIRFHRNGSISEAFVDTQGILLTVGSNNIRIPGKAPIEFYEDGNIRKVYIDDNTLLQTGTNLIPFFGYICFYPSGQILSGNIKGKLPLVVGKRTITFCDTGGYYATKRFEMIDGNISFNENGTIHSGLLSDTTKFNLFGHCIRIEPQGVYFDSLGQLEVIVNTNEILRYRTDKPMLIFDDEIFKGDTFCPEFNNETPPEDLADELSNDFQLRIGGNTLLFARKQKYRHNNMSYSNIVPNQRVRIGINEMAIKTLGSVDGTGQLFHANGAIRGVILLDDVELIVGKREIKFLCKNKGSSDDADVGFYCDGSVAFGVIGHEISDSIYEYEPEYYLYKKSKISIMANQRVYFKKDGSVKYSVDGYNYLIKEYSTDVYSPQMFFSE